MPSPGQSAIATALGEATFDVEVTNEDDQTENRTQKFEKDGVFIQQLATAIHTGWTSVTPSTVTTMVTVFENVFTNLLGNGKNVVLAIAQGIDVEVAAWAASWDSTKAKHLYEPDADAIYDKIINAVPITSNGIEALAQAVADAFMAGFGQEAG